MLKYLLTRFKEPSSWAGFASLAIVFGVPTSTAQTVINAVTAVAAAVAIFVPEKAE